MTMDHTPAPAPFLGRPGRSYLAFHRPALATSRLLRWSTRPTITIDPHDQWSAIAGSLGVRVPAVRHPGCGRIDPLHILPTPFTSEELTR